MKKYLKKANNGSIKGIYKQSTTGKGRYGATGPLSLQCIERRIHHTICREFYDDVDVKNAHPVFLDQYCTKKEIPHPRLTYYVEHRDDLFQEMMTSQGMTKDEVKTLIFKSMKGGLVSEEDLQAYPIAISQFWVEMKDIRARMIEGESDMVGRARRKKKRNNQSDWNLDRSVMNLVLCDIENQVLMTMLDYLTQSGNSAEVLCYDGLQVRKNESRPITVDVLTECSVYIDEKVGWKCELIVKPMDHCTPTAPSLHPHCTLTASSLPPPLAAPSLYPHCTLTAPSLHP